MQLQLSITFGGGVGTAQFSWTSDNVTFHTGVLTGASVVLGSTGVTAHFAVGSTYSTDNVYAAATPVPEIVLNWLQLYVTYDLYKKRGANPADPQMQWLIDDVNKAEAELKEAADSKDGLFDLPSSEDEGSAITTAGPLAYTETSPYKWTNKERGIGRRQDEASFSEDTGDDFR
jgi:hypothetical protein